MRSDAITIHIADRPFQSLKKVVANDQLLEMAGLDSNRNQKFLVYKVNHPHRIDND